MVPKVADWPFAVSIICLAVSCFCSGAVLLGPAVAAPPPPVGWTTAATVVEVYDGDTVVVAVTRRMRVRLLDCWAPEVRTRDAEEKLKGYAARDRLRELLPVGEECVLHVPGDVDLGKAFTFGRLLGHVWESDDSDRSVSEIMVAEGFATKSKARNE